MTDEGSSAEDVDSDDLPLAKERKAIAKRITEEREKSPLPSEVCFPGTPQNFTLT